MSRRYKFSETAYRRARWAERADEAASMRRRRGNVLARLNKRAPWLKVCLLVAVVMFGWASVIVIANIRPESRQSTEPNSTLTSAPRLSDGLELDLTLAEVEVEATAEEAETPPAPTPLPPPVYAPSDAAVPGPKLVALTFDDGPMDSTTPRLLDILKEKDAKATFFELGRQIRVYPEITKRAVAEGHQVESHSVHHQNYYYMAAVEIQADTAEMTTILTETIGRPTRMMRVPYGLYNEITLANIGVPHIGWSVDAQDWREERRNAELLRELTVTATFDGAIILLHDIYPSTVEAMGGIIDDLKNFGYEFVTVEEMAARRGAVLEPGGVYLGF